MAPSEALTKTSACASLASADEAVFWLFFVIVVGVGIYGFIRRSRAQVVTERLLGLEVWRHDDGKLAGQDGDVIVASHVSVHFPSMRGIPATPQRAEPRRRRRAGRP